MRLEHCHFAQLYEGKIVGTNGWCYGVVDHNFFDCRNGSFTAEIFLTRYGGSTQLYGNGAWADYPWYGTDKFWFFEDNMIKGSGSGGGVSGTIDSYYGGRFVARHNYWLNAAPSTHGTEGQLLRGVRAVEFYNNTVNWTVPCTGSGQRSGGSLWHDNTYLGTIPAMPTHTVLANYRETPARSNSVWGIADGTSVWDQNDTQGNGTCIEGAAPHVFASGTATAPSALVGGTGTLVDSTKNWTAHQWVGYSVKNTNPNSASYPLGSYIIDNNAHSLTYFYYVASDTPKHLVFATGDTYRIHRVLTMMDQNGRGKGDQVTGSPPINQKTGTPFWTHQALEPCYSWNNVHTPTHTVLGYSSKEGQPTTKAGVDYFNLGAGFTANTTPSQVSSRYGASLNGQNYTGTFTYPHPLVSDLAPPGDLASPSNLNIVP
jgi:hypothetical protein